MTLPAPWDSLSYDPITGSFTWVKPRGCAKVGSHAGSRLGDYWAISLGKKTHLAHRCAVYLMTGHWPSAGMTVDHIDGDKMNNRWSNLRVVSQRINNQNLRSAISGSKSGLIGAHWNAQENKWQASIRHDGRNIYLGRFSTAQEAHAAYVSEKRRLHVGCTI